MVGEKVPGRERKEATVKGLGVESGVAGVW